MEKYVITIMCIMSYMLKRTISAPIIKASGVQWSEPKGTGKGNITLIMLPQYNATGNDSDMIVAVKSDYQILSQDTQLLNLVVNENKNRSTELKFDKHLQNCSNLEAENVNKNEREILKFANNAKYFEPERELSSRNNTNTSMIDSYPSLLKNYHNLIAFHETSTTSSYDTGTLNIFQLLSTSVTNSKPNNSSGEKSPIASVINNSVTSKYNDLNLTNVYNYNYSQENVKSQNNNLSLPYIASDDNFLNEAFNVLEILKQDPSFYNKLKSNLIPSLRDIKDNEQISLTKSKINSLKPDMSIDEKYILDREFGHINHENQEICNLEGSANENIMSSTCLPFFMSFNIEQTSTHDTYLGDQQKTYLDRDKLAGTGSNLSQEFNQSGKILSSNNILTFLSKCKPLTPIDSLDQESYTTSPIRSHVVSNIGHGVQISDSFQTLTVENCKTSDVLMTESQSFTPLIANNIVVHGTGSGEVSQITATENYPTSSKNEIDFLQHTLGAANIAGGSAVNVSNLCGDVHFNPSFSGQIYSKNEPNLLLQTLAAANIASGAVVSDSDLSQNPMITKAQTQCVTSYTISNSTLSIPENYQANKSQLQLPATTESPAVPDKQVLRTPVTKSENLSSMPLLGIETSILGSSVYEEAQNPLPQKGLGIKTTNCMENGLSLPTLSSTYPSQKLNILSEIHTECVTNANALINQEAGIPQAGVGAAPKKITLEPQINCETAMKKEESTTCSKVENQEASIGNKDLTLPLVESSIFLANNNEMPKGKDIPISLNASLDEFSLSDLQEMEEKVHGKLAELYNHNPLVNSVEIKKKSDTFSKQQQPNKNNNEKIIESPNLYVDKMYGPEADQVLQMNFPGKKIILKQRPSYQTGINNQRCNKNLDKDDKLTKYEMEPDNNNSTDFQPESVAIIKPQKNILLQPVVQNENYQVPINRSTYSPGSWNEEESLLTILNTLEKTTSGINNDDRSMENFSLVDTSFNISYNSLSAPMPNNIGNVSNNQESFSQETKVKNTTVSSTSKQDYENVKSHPPEYINLTKKQPQLSQKPSSRFRAKLNSKDSKIKIGAKKTMCIPADSLKKIVIEIVRDPKTSNKKQDSSSTVHSRIDSESEDQIKVAENNKVSCEGTNSMKQNFVRFKSAWKPVQSMEKYPFSLTNYLQQDEIFSDDKISNNNIKAK